MWVDLHGYSGWTGWQVKYVRSPPTYKLHTHLLLYPHCSDWPGLNCWMHPKEEGSPSGMADNECPLSILESESHRETGRRRERERSYTVLSFTCEAAPLTVFLLFCSISISPKSPPPSPFSISSLPSHIHIRAEFTDRLLHWPWHLSIYRDFDLQSPRRSPPPPGVQQGNGTQGKSRMAGVTFTHDR